MAESNEQIILDAVDSFLDKEVRPVAKSLELADEYPTDIVEKMKVLGLFGATIPEQYGGLGLSAGIYAHIVERVSAVWMSISGIFNSHLIMSAAIEKFATEQQKERFLPLLARGELRGGIALTEPDCGTDLQAVRTRATLEGDEYVINGTKQWITNAVEGNVLLVLVKTDPNTQPRHRGMSLLVVEKASGYRAFKLAKLGYRGIDTGDRGMRQRITAGLLDAALRSRHRARLLGSYREPFARQFANLYADPLKVIRLYRNWLAFCSLHQERTAESLVVQFYPRLEIQTPGQWKRATFTAFPQ